MRSIVALLAALAAYPVAAGLVRLLLTLATMPLMNVNALVHSRACLGVLRFAVGCACGAAALGAGVQLLAALGGGAALVLAGAVLAMVATLHIWGAWPFRGTAQLADDMLSLAGEGVGVVVVAGFLIGF